MNALLLIFAQTLGTMSDVNAHLIQPLKKFAKDSIHLVKKCTKPDRKGEAPSITLIYVRMYS